MKFTYLVSFGGKHCIPGIVGDLPTLAEAQAETKRFSESQCPGESEADWKVFHGGELVASGNYSRITRKRTP